MLREKFERLIRIIGIKKETETVGSSLSLKFTEDKLAGLGGGRLSQSDP